MSDAPLEERITSDIAVTKDLFCCGTANFNRQSAALARTQHAKAHATPHHTPRAEASLS
jgi:hypothetical protein